MPARSVRQPNSTRPRISVAAARRALAGLVIAFAAMTLLPSVASAELRRNEISSFNGADASTGAFSNLGQVAVDQDTGTLYAIDAGAGTVDRFDASGAAENYPALGSSSLSGNAVSPPDGPTYFGFSGLGDVAVDNSGSASDGNLVVLGEGSATAWIFDRSGNYLTQITGFGDACGAAVDPAGHIWIADYNAQSVIEYSAGGVPTGRTIDTSSGLSPVCHIDFDASGNLYAGQYNRFTVVYDASGVFVRTLDFGTSQGVTVNRTNGRVYVTRTDGVVEYGADGTRLGKFAGNGSDGPEGGAVNEQTDQVYVGRIYLQTIGVFGPAFPVADVSTEGATSVTKATATLNGTVNPQGELVTDCHFEYGLDAGSYTDSVPCAQSVGGGTGPVEVSADLSGLDSLQTFHFRLVATDANGSNAGSDLTFLTADVPGILRSSVSEISDTTAKVTAQINPAGASTTLHVEYGPTDSYGSTTGESAPIGDDLTAHSVARLIPRLAPGTTYHARVVATNAQGTTYGPDEVFTTIAAPSAAPASDSCANARFRTGPASQMRNCRAYEMVSPVDKNGANVQSPCNNYCQRAELVQAAVSGDKLTYSAAASFADQISAPFSNQYLASRGTTGWTNHGINAPRDASNHQSYDPAFDIDKTFNAFSDDLSQAWLFNNNRKPLTPDAPDDTPPPVGGIHRENSYRLDLTSGKYTVIPTFDNRPADIAGISADGRHAVVTDSLGETLSDNFNGVSSQVNLLPDGTTAPHPNLGTTFGFGVSDVTNVDRGERVVKHAVSDDGSRIFWTRGGSFSASGDLYVRIDGERTVEIARPGNFRTASPDGTKVLYDTVTIDDINREPLNGSLYVFDVDSQTQRLVASDFIGVIGSSDDLSYVYFVSKSALAPGAVAGARNVYVNHDGHDSFVAEMSEADLIDPDTSNESKRPIARTVRVTPDGRHLIFESNRSLTGYDSRDAETDAPVIEVYRYAAASGDLTCVSCNPSGARPAGQLRPFPYTAIDGPVLTGALASAWLPTEQTSLYASRPLSSDGSRVFFNSFDALVTRDTNNAQDVYEWEQQGSGGCDTQGGCVSLISSGLSRQRSEFIDADPSGDNVFFETAASLVADDSDTLVDIYDARVGGGFESRPSPAPDCEGDACQPATPDRGSTADGAASRVPGLPDGGAAKRATLSVAELSAAQRLRLAAGKAARLRVTVNGPGRIAARGVSRINKTRHTVVVGNLTAKRAGSFSLQLQLTPAARRQLARSGDLTVSLSVTFSAVRQPVVRTVRLHRGRTAKQASTTKGGR